MPFSVSDVLSWTGGRIVNSDRLGSSLGAIRIERPAESLASSRSHEVSFFFSRAYQNDLFSASPGVLITGEDFVRPLEAAGVPLWQKSAVIACRDPYLAMAQVTEKLADGISTVAHVSPSASETEIHPTAIVSPGATLGSGVRIGPHCVIEKDVKIGAGTVLYPGCYVGPACQIGERCVLFPGVKLYEWTQIGNRVRLHAGCVLGADGFGYAPRIEAGQCRGHQKIYHFGRVVLGDDVEVGANTCIDRSTFGETRVDRGAKIDNMVQIGHNVTIGEGSIVCGSVGIAGSAQIGKYVYVMGLAGIDNQVQVGDGARLGAMSLIGKDVPAGATVVGNPMRNHKDHFRLHAMLNRMLAERKKRGGNKDDG